MIYTASYFERGNHHGKLISISRSVPKGFKIDGELPFFAPSQKLLNEWKFRADQMTVAEYTDRFRIEMWNNRVQIHQWLEGLDLAVDQTLLCWERSDALGRDGFCHRRLIYRYVEKHRPDCMGGCDVPNKPEQLELIGVAPKTNRNWGVGIE